MLHDGSFVVAPCSVDNCAGGGVILAMASPLVTWLGPAHDFAASQIFGGDARDGVALNCSDSKNRPVNCILNLIPYGTLLRVEAGKKCFREIFLPDLEAMVSKPLELESPVTADRSLPIVPQQSHEIPSRVREKN